MNDGAPNSVTGDVAGRLRFLTRLQDVANKVHATQDTQEIMLELSQDICDLFDADRMTIYVVGEDKNSIVSSVKVGLSGFKDIKLPISEVSVAGYVAQHKRLVNLVDVYDEAELKKFSPRMKFLKEVDQRTGYRCKQMLVAPIVDADNGLLGVIQLINHKVDKPFPALAVEGVQEFGRTLAVALARREKSAVLKTRYDALIDAAIISEDEMVLAQRAARRKQVPLEDVLVEEFKVSLADLGRALSTYFSVPYEPFRADRVRPIDLLRNLKRDYVEANRWLPVEDSTDGLVVMCPDPESVRQSRIVNNVFPKARIAYRVTTQPEFAKTVSQFFGALADVGSVTDILSDLDEDDYLDQGSEDAAAAADNELVRLVNKIIIDAYQQGASDIHIEPRPGKDKVGVRFRKDGSLVKYIEVPAAYRNALVARLKIMCDLDISEKRRPQDGKIKFKKYGPLDIELRVATLPTAGGIEDVVMRILAAGEPMPLDKIGLSRHNYDALLRCIEKPYGLFFVCGPTGSGKTTTLHSILGKLNTPDTKIWTAEDPVEITQKGLRQVQVNKKAGLDFATVMKAFLRADPDIIMVGEMRDPETTAIGIEASLTGHLVLATLHTNSAPESIVRLLDMGMDPFNFADALLGILAQRLGKRLCPDCKEAYVADDAEMQALLDEYCSELTRTERWQADPDAARQACYQEWLDRHAQNGVFRLQRARGCAKCSDTGYRGRVGLHELMVGSDAVKRLIQEHARVASLLAEALNAGMRTLKMDGIEKVLQGVTDIKQVRAVCIK